LIRTLLLPVRCWHLPRHWQNKRQIKALVLLNTVEGQPLPFLKSLRSIHMITSLRKLVNRTGVIVASRNHGKGLSFRQYDIVPPVREFYYIPDGFGWQKFTRQGITQRTTFCMGEPKRLCVIDGRIHELKRGGV
jgi:hypothetical protein